MAPSIEEAKAVLAQALEEAEAPVREAEEQHAAALQAWEADPTPVTRAAMEETMVKCADARRNHRQERAEAGLGHIMQGDTFPTPPEEVANLRNEACADPDCLRAPKQHQDFGGGVDHDWQDPAQVATAAVGQIEETNS